VDIWSSNNGGALHDPVIGLANQGANQAFGQNNPISGGISQVSGTVFGDNSTPGIFGLGHYGVDQNAFGPIDPSGMYAGANAAGSRTTPQFDNSTQSAAEGQQQQLIQMLMDQANGKGPSIAQDMLKQASDRNMQQTAAMMASQRGAGAQAGAYNAAVQGGNAGQQLASDSSMLRLQEQLQARGMLGNVLGQTRGQDISAAQDTVAAQLQGQQLNDQLVQFYTQQGNSLEQANRQAQIDLQNLREKSYDASRGGNSGGGSFMSGIGGLISAL
jgi:hypothetical protein